MGKGMDVGLASEASPGVSPHENAYVCAHSRWLGHLYMWVLVYTGGAGRFNYHGASFGPEPPIIWVLNTSHWKDRRISCLCPLKQRINCGCLFLKCVWSSYLE